MNEGIQPKEICYVMITEGEEGRWMVEKWEEEECEHIQWSVGEVVVHICRK